ncbi:plasmid maintenance system antidote protein [Clostridium sartagoforme AAU1]|uniref:Plasmid maintenance system antidote protein n=1 Tax=Clostridium sartagoforme AAU1 TaxID=1202534 RepID=R9CJQ9_9CLOT|nr:helix-turn-helix transcriptional regulator [Clostridium sartagoforme]EOR27391.1 plasmid maintenance system antidote protein [Clostridium sartagoforme AAU1]
MKVNGLKFIRKTFGLTMKELSDEIGVSSNTINLWEKGLLDVTEERLNQLAEFFGLENKNIFHVILMLIVNVPVK